MEVRERNMRERGGFSVAVADVRETGAYFCSGQLWDANQSPYIA